MMLFPPWVIDMMHEYNVREAKRNLEAYAHFLEEMRMSETKHDGKLDTREFSEGAHAECRIVPPGMTLEVSDIVGRTIAHTYLDTKQALSLLAWLRQEEETLKGLAKEQAE